MLIGFNAPTAGPLSAADNLAKIVIGAEAMGFGYATFSDHVQDRLQRLGQPGGALALVGQADLSTVVRHGAFALEYLAHDG